ncbi:MAG TPA: hypothetical protein VLR46_09725, partial [Candidatus Dormibacteraeota bacterium]|nr:hypothetical protein [Candidatus Dormibacteraeota bacterium]
MNDIAAGAPLDILAPEAAPIECVPAIMDLDLEPDMGRMTGRLGLIAYTTNPRSISASTTGPCGTSIATAT